MRLVETGIHPVLVLTQPDRPSGRGRRLVPSAVKEYASEHSLSVFQPTRLKADADVAVLAGVSPDLLIVAAYGLILSQRVLDVPRFGCLNVHASLLPRWRGAAPVERAMLAGDAETGVSLMQMDAGLDTGPVYARTRTDIGNDETGAQLELRLADLGARQLLEFLPALLAGSHVATPQEQLPLLAAADRKQHGLPSYAPKLTRADAQLDWSASAAVLARTIRALSGRVSVEVHVGDARVQLLRATSIEAADANVNVGTIVSVRPTIDVQCVDGILQISQLRFVDRGKGAVLSAAQAANGFSQILHAGAQIDVSR